MKQPAVPVSIPSGTAFCRNCRTRWALRPVAVLACLLALALCGSTASAAPNANADADADADAGAPAAGGTATISGNVRITRKLISQRMRFRLYPGVKSVSPPEEALEIDEKRNIVIYLEHVAASPANAIPLQNPRIRQEGETFVPHVLPVVRGTTVDFPNLDPIFHNVFSLAGAISFDLGRYPQGSSRSVTFDQAGVVPVFCHLHSDMSAIILVLENPYYSVPDSAGRYRIENIPPGTYTLVGWHERSDRTEQRVTVKPGELLQLDILIPIEDEE